MTGIVPTEIIDAEDWETFEPAPPNWWGRRWFQPMLSELQADIRAAGFWGKAARYWAMLILIVMVVLIGTVKITLKFLFVVALALFCRAIIGFFLGDD